eukprot:409683-Pelagomonas_calceolata.AAC.4
MGLAAPLLEKAWGCRPQAMQATQLIGVMHVIYVQTCIQLFFQHGVEKHIQCMLVWNRPAPLG